MREGGREGGGRGGRRAVYFVGMWISDMHDTIYVVL